MRLSTRTRAIALAIATALAVPATSFVATTAQAQGPGDPPPPPEYAAEPVYRGKTTTNVAVRLHPTQASERLVTIKKNRRIKIFCKYNGPSVDGNKRWYMFALGLSSNSYRWSYIAARYVENVGTVPRFCKLGSPDGKVVAKSGVKIRTAPSLDAKVVGRLAYGKKIHTTCKVNGPNVSGNKRWYQLRDGNWVPARWVDNIDKRIIPQPCYDESLRLH